jgi:D-tyrosyl-tRNA(Tyr) deacylase
LVLAGFADGDNFTDCQTMASKIRYLRVFNDEHGKMNLDIGEVGGSVLAVSQFTLLADTRKGRRPSYRDAAPPQVANLLMNHFVESLRAQGLTVETGQFQAHMEVSLVNDGPVTILLNSRDYQRTRDRQPHQPLCQ